MEEEANLQGMSDEPLESQLDYYRDENNRLRQANSDLLLELDLLKRNSKASKEVTSYEQMDENNVPIASKAENTIKKCLEAMEVIYKNHCDLMAETDAKLFTLDGIYETACTAEEAKAILLEYLDDKESEARNPESELKD
jgi:hypothetical protein